MGAQADNTNITAGQIPVSTSRGATGGQQLQGSTALTSNDLLHKQVTISNAQMLALNATPVELIAAPGADKVIVAERISAKHVYATAAFSDTDLTVEYDGGSAIAVATIDATNFLNGVSADTIRPQLNPTGGAAVVDAAADITNKNLALTAASDPTTGGGTMVLDIWYRIADYSS